MVLETDVNLEIANDVASKSLVEEGLVILMLSMLPMPSYAAKFDTWSKEAITSAVGSTWRPTRSNWLWW